MDNLQVRFFEVSEEELEKQRSAFSNGQLKIKIEEDDFSMRYVCLIFVLIRESFCIGIWLALPAAQ